MVVEPRRLFRNRCVTHRNKGWTGEIRTISCYSRLRSRLWSSAQSPSSSFSSCLLCSSVYYSLLLLHHGLVEQTSSELDFRASNCFLLAASLIFYAWGELRLIGVMIATILIDYTSDCLIISGAYRGGEVKPLP